LSSSPNIIRMIKRMGEMRNAYRILVGKPEGRNHWEGQGVGGWTILKWIWLRIGTSGGLL
jgi:hypothetical protein